MGNFNDWWDNQDEDFTNEVGPDLKTYWNSPASLGEVKELDDQHIHNDPADDNVAPRNLDTEVDL